MVTIQTTEGLLRFSTDYMCALEAHCSRHADHACKFLQLSFGDPPRWPNLGMPVLFELGAVLDLGYWEAQGLDFLHKLGFPKYSQATHELAHRCETGPGEFSDEKSAILSRRLLETLTAHLAWTGPRLFSAELVLDCPNDDDFVNLIADFAWRFRKSIKPQTEDK